MGQPESAPAATALRLGVFSRGVARARSCDVVAPTHHTQQIAFGPLASRVRWNNPKSKTTNVLCKRKERRDPRTARSRAHRGHTARAGTGAAGAGGRPGTRHTARTRSRGVAPRPARRYALCARPIRAHHHAIEGRKPSVSPCTHPSPTINPCHVLVVLSSRR